MAWRRGQSYSEDLRGRVLAAVEGGMGAYAVAALFRVSVSYVYKALGRRRATGEATARPRLGRRPGQKLAALHEALRARVAAEPGATLAELRQSNCASGSRPSTAPRSARAAACGRRWTTWG